MLLRPLLVRSVALLVGVVALAALSALAGCSTVAPQPPPVIYAPNQHPHP